MKIAISKIERNEIDRVEEILQNVISNMKEIGFNQWDESYPTRDILLEDIENRWLYGAYSKNDLLGFAALNRYQDEEYNSITWRFSEPCLMVHRLQVDTNFRGKGVAHEIMLFAERLAIIKECSSIRLDTRSDNSPALRLYEKLGYEKRGVVHFPRMIEYDFICFEKEIL